MNDVERKNRIETLKERKKHCCCRYCGGELELRRVIFSDYDNARVEIFCSECNRIEYGVEKEIYENAKYFVEKIDYNYFSNLADNEETKRMNVAMVCDVISYFCKNMHLIDEHGFCVPVDFDREMANDIMVVCSEGEARSDE